MINIKWLPILYNGTNLTHQKTVKFSENFGQQTLGKPQNFRALLIIWNHSINQCCLSRSFIDNCFGNKFVCLCSTTLSL